MPVEERGPRPRRRAAFNIDLDFVVTEWFFDELFGLTSQDTVGKPYQEWISSDAHRPHRLRTLRETGRFMGIAVVADRHNEHVVVYATARPIRRNGRPDGWHVDLREMITDNHP